MNDLLNELCPYRLYRLLNRIDCIGYRIGETACFLVDTVPIYLVPDTLIRRYSFSVRVNEIGALDLIDIAL
jgi:hypothetical protein